jgi:hypothetical protein
VPVIHAYLNPLVKWIWFGGVIVVFGTVLAMLPNRRTVLVLRPVEAARREPLLDVSPGSPAMQPIRRSADSHD